MAIIYDFFTRKRREAGPLTNDKIHRFVLDDTGGYILLGWEILSMNRRGLLDIRAYLLPETGPRLIDAYEYRASIRTGEIVRYYHWMNLARKKMDWSSPDFCYTGSLDLLPPNPDRRAAYLARKQEVRAAK